MLDAIASISYIPLWGSKIAREAIVFASVKETVKIKVLKRYIAVAEVETGVEPVVSSVARWSMCRLLCTTTPLTIHLSDAHSFHFLRC